MWQSEQRGRCDRCGTWPWEWETNPDAWYADHTTCEGCRRLDQHQHDVNQGPGYGYGIRYGLYNTPREG